MNADELDLNELREQLSQFLTLSQTERDALLMNLLNWLLERVAALETNQLLSWADMKDEQAQQWKAQKRAPTVLYEGDSTLREFFDGNELFLTFNVDDAPALSRGDRVHVVVTAERKVQS